MGTTAETVAPATTEVPDHTAKALAGGQQTIDDLRKQFGASPEGSIQGAILLARETQWQQMENKLCGEVNADVRAGASREDAYKAMLEKAGFETTPLLSCAPPQQASPADLGQMNATSVPDKAPASKQAAPLR